MKPREAWKALCASGPFSATTSEIFAEVLRCLGAKELISQDHDGSLVIGEIKRVKLGVVTFDPDDANDITVQLRKLKSIASGKRIFRIETVDNHLYFGTIGPCPAPDTINILMT